MNQGTIALLVFTIACLVIVAIISTCQSSAAVHEDKSSNEAVEATIKRKAEEKAKAEAEEEKEKRALAAAERKKEAKEEKEKAENKKWEKEGPDFVDIYKVGDMVNHIGQPCMVIASKNRESEFGILYYGWRSYSICSRRVSTPDIYGWTKQEASIWVQFGDQMEHHKLSEEDVKLKITK